jgi:hypothetical protein
MQRGHKLADPAALGLPEGFDPCGVPCLDHGRTRRRAASSHRRQHDSLPGLAPTSLIASVEGVATEGEADWLIWGSADDRPVLFDVEAGAAAEMMSSVARGETATAIIEPWQLVLERLD